LETERKEKKKKEKKKKKKTLMSSESVKKPIRVWVDGCFDLMHWGHANLCRQAKALGDVLVVGVHSDADVRLNKGPPVMNEAERYAAVRAVKWVDEVVEAAPYYTDVELCKRHNIDYIVHGDDVSVGADGTDTYAAAKAAGMFRTVPRTIGVSSTDLVGRMLLLTRQHHIADATVNAADQPPIAEMATPKTCVSQCVPTSRRIVQFSNRKDPSPSDTIVYVDGAFDLFHVGHVQFLEEARKLGTYVICGVLPDEMLNKWMGANYPIMNVYERTLSVLSCRFVDEVIIGAPEITEQFLKDYNISVVVHGTTYEPVIYSHISQTDWFATAKRLGKFREIPSPSTLTTGALVERILAHRAEFLKRQQAKFAREAVINADK
jgi:ethanolamine-phosphate cytidylyltransferase